MIVLHLTDFNTDVAPFINGDILDVP